jgi:SNF2 family DNA or RNA helicase
MQGLGKTVEMLALFLARPPPPGWLPHRPPTHPGASEAQAQAAPGGGEAGGREAGAGEPQAAVPDASLGAIKSGDGGPAGSPRRGGTLVVCPPALLQQWAAELSNHAHGALAVEVYDGLGGLGAALRREGPAAKRLKPGQREAELYSRLLQGGSVQASYDAAAEAAAALCRLSRADVVLTSFDVLRAEVHFVPRERELRHRKRYQVPHCPLLQVRRAPPPAAESRGAACRRPVAHAPPAPWAACATRSALPPWAPSPPPRCAGGGWWRMRRRWWGRSQRWAP